ncbi:MAG: hypothetical protein ACLURV_13330 [Gallintestinimicrobium sp.]
MGAFFRLAVWESGLPVCFVNRIPETDGRKTVLVELRANARILKEHPNLEACMWI